MKSEEPVALRHLTQCLDGRRIPLNSAERHDIPGEIPYWGSGGVVGTVGEYLFDEPLVLLGEDGAPFYDRNRDVAFKVSGKTWVNNHIHVLRPNADVDHAFLTYALNSVDYSLYISGSTRDKLTQEDMRRIMVPMWQLVRQRQIALFLDRETAQIDALIGKQERLIELLAEKRQAIISHAVTKGVDPTAPTKPSGIPWLDDVPAHWRVAALKHILRIPISDGPHETPEFFDEGVPFVSAEAVSSGAINFSKIRGFISDADNQRYSRKYSPRRGDIYMVKSGATTGVTALVETDQKFNIWSPLAAIRCDDSVLPEFLLAFLRSRAFLDSVALHWSFGTQQNIGMGVLGDLPVATPPLDEQRRIADHLRTKTLQIDVLRDKAHAVVATLKERRSALISAAVTGKIDVREGAA